MRSFKTCTLVKYNYNGPVKEDEISRVCSINEKLNSCRVLVLVRYRWVVNIRMGLNGIEWHDMGWIVLAQDRGWWRAHGNKVMGLSVPLKFRKYPSNCATGSFCRRAQLYEVSWLLKRDKEASLM
jgi:hypothetical protein